MSTQSDLTLFHGTTLHRAQLIFEKGPNIYFYPEIRSEGFFACPAHGPFASSGTPEHYACLHSRANPTHNGAALLVFDVPMAIAEMTPDFAENLSQGFIAFTKGPSIDALKQAWPKLKKRIIPFDCKVTIGTLNTMTKKTWTTR